jgi:hypothetical protein
MDFQSSRAYVLCFRRCFALWHLWCFSAHKVNPAEHMFYALGAALLFGISGVYRLKKSKEHLFNAAQMLLCCLAYLVF